MTQKVEVRVEIDGIYYNIVSEKSEKESVQLARYVDRKINEAKANNKNLTSTMAATLASMNIANDYFQIQKTAEEHKKENQEAIDNYGPLKASCEKLREELRQAEAENAELKDKLVQSLETIQTLNTKNLSHEQQATQREIATKEKDRQLAALQTKMIELQDELSQMYKKYSELEKRVVGTDGRKG